MTIYELSVITNSGFPYYHLKLQKPPKGVRLYLRFFDFSKYNPRNEIDLDSKDSFDLDAGLVSALYEFARSINKEIEILEFVSKKEEVSKKSLYKGDVLITAQTEGFLLHKSISEKIKLIYDNIIRHKIPLVTAQVILQNEEDQIINYLMDSEARSRINMNKKKLETLAKSLLNDMKNYGLNSICICSFDLSPLILTSEKYTMEEIHIILRNIGIFPEIKPLEWIYRQSYIKNEPIWVYIIKSGIGPNIDGLLQPYFYLLIAEPQSYLGEFPGKLTLQFNQVLG
jgi:molybdenum cofactor biosynthesis enzyme